MERDKRTYTLLDDSSGYDFYLLAREDVNLGFCICDVNSRENLLGVLFDRDTVVEPVSINDFDKNDIWSGRPYIAKFIDNKDMKVYISDVDKVMEFLSGSVKFSHSARRTSLENALVASREDIRSRLFSIFEDTPKGMVMGDVKSVFDFKKKPQRHFINLRYGNDFGIVVQGDSVSRQLVLDMLKNNCRASECNIDDIVPICGEEAIKYLESGHHIKIRYELSIVDEKF